MPLLRSFSNPVHGSSACVKRDVAFHEPLQFERFCGWPPTQPRSVEEQVERKGIAHRYATHETGVSLMCLRQKFGFSRCERAEPAQDGLRFLQLFVAIVGSAILKVKLRPCTQRSRCFAFRVD